MAKQQDLPLSPMEISGCCGRLLCCLAYENEQYAEIKAHFPKVGKTVQISCGPVKVLKVDALSEMATVLLEDGTVRQLTAEQLSGEAPLECGEEESLSDDQREAADMVVPVMIERTMPIRSTPRTEEPAVEKAPRIQPRNTPPPAPNVPRRELRPNLDLGQRRRPLAEVPVQPRQEQAQPIHAAVDAPPGAEDNDAEERRRHRRGGRHRPRHGRRPPGETPSASAEQAKPGAG
jgi:hypothetical protein